MIEVLLSLTFLSGVLLNDSVSILEGSQDYTQYLKEDGVKTLVSLEEDWDDGLVLEVVVTPPPEPEPEPVEEDQVEDHLEESKSEVPEEAASTPTDVLVSRSETPSTPVVNPDQSIIPLLKQVRPMNQIAQYANGSVPGSLLCSVPWSPSFQVYCPTLEPLKKLNHEYMKQFGKNISFASAYRPGFQGRSFHGWGMAIDLNGSSGLMKFSDPEYRWMMVNAPKFGWYHPFWAGAGGMNPEAWHWEFGSYYHNGNYLRDYNSAVPPVIIQWIKH